MKKPNREMDTLFAGLSNVYRGHQAGRQLGGRFPSSVSTATKDAPGARRASKRRSQAT